ncbi:hypothetical protein THOE12_130183 [Vibrio rotiferianus]|nr:hypothetical protein THOE12_130183 [Vibrio rotiferianus]
MSDTNCRLVYRLVLVGETYTPYLNRILTLNYKGALLSYEMPTVKVLDKSMLVTLRNLTCFTKVRPTSILQTLCTPD